MEKDRAYKESTAVKIKTWGDALRNTITKIPSEGIDVVSCVKHRGALFCV